MKISRVIAIVIAPAMAVAVWSGTAHASTAAQPQAQRTCTAFANWEAHRTTANIDAMMADTFGGSWTGTSKYIVSDAASLYGDVRSNAAAKYVTNDIKYMASDCSGD
jgi:hypothetical protein